MSSVPTEYKVFKKKFYKSLEKALGENLVGIVVYGGSATDRIFPGVSDVDFFILLKRVENLTRPLSEIYSAINTVITEFISNPLFAAILDYDVYTEDQIPNEDNLNGFSAIRALALTTGEKLSGSNPFEGMNIDGSELLKGARTMVQEYLNKLTSSAIITEFDDEDTRDSILMEQEFNAIDAVLSSAQAYMMVKQGKYITMPDIVYGAETDPVDGFDNELIVDVGLLRQGVEKDVKDLYNRAIDFCGQVMKLL